MRCDKHGERVITASVINQWQLNTCQVDQEGCRRLILFRASGTSAARLVSPATRPKSKPCM